MTDLNSVAKPALATVEADIKATETALKQPSKTNWLFIAGVAVVANLVGVFLHL